jgi:uncharacterized protein YkwD
MAKSKIIILVLIIAAFGAGIFFKDDVIRLYNNFSKQIRGTLGVVKKIDIGTTLTQVGKEILNPPPLNIVGSEKQVTLLQSKIIAETNLQRQENGNLPSLKENTKLDEAAAAKASDMFKNQYFEHVSPSGVDPGKLVQSYGYDYIVTGENLILGNFSSEKEVVQDWMNSPGHRANILNNRYTEIGAAIIKGTYKGDTVWIGVQEFGLPLASCAQPNASFKDKIDYDRSQLDSIALQINDKKSQIENTSQDSPAYNQMINDYNQLVSQYNSLAEQVKQEIANYNAQVNNFNNCVAGK